MVRNRVCENTLMNEENRWFPGARSIVVLPSSMICHSQHRQQERSHIEQLIQYTGCWYTLEVRDQSILYIAYIQLERL